MLAPLPGHVREIRSGDDCPCQYDECKDAATHEYCTEADGMGAEWLPLCNAHLEQFKKDVEAGGPTIDTCDWCKAHDVEIFPFRDWEEGSNGPVYDVCNACIRKSNDYAHEELKRMEDEEDEFAEMPDLDDGEIEDLFCEQVEERDPQWEAEQLFRKTMLMLNPIRPDVVDDSKFNLNGPVLVDGQLGFSAHWQDGVQVVMALDLEFATLYWQVYFTKGYYLDGMDERMQKVRARIRTWGYDARKIEEL